jgi:hypothetical protein
MTFNNTAQSDFMKLVAFPEDKKANLINYASNDFLSLRDSLVDYIKAVYPLEYDYFVESDLGMMLIELVAYMGAVMSLKADFLANENYLVTARDRNSIKKLFELIGVRLKGPLSSAAQASITFNGVAGSVIIPIENRTITVRSPEDGANLAFTIYKTTNGIVQTANSTGQISLSQAESAGTLGFTWQNIILQEGALVSDEGEFAATETIKTIPLTESPVIEGSIEVYINTGDSTASGAYTEVDNIFFASSTNQKIYQVVYDDNYKATILFGNGIRGVIPPDNSSYIVTYRVGGGSRGNIVSNYINSNITEQGTRTGVVTNTTGATGGADAETAFHAKKYGPLTFARQDRVVTLEDYTVFSNTFISDYGTVGKATAVTRKAYSSGNIIDIYVLEKANNLQVQKASPTFKQQLIAALQPKKMVTDEVVVVDGLVRTLDLIVTVKVDKNLKPKDQLIKSKVRNAILDFMAVDNREFGETLVVADLNRVIFEIEEIRISSIDNVPNNIKVEFNELIQLNNLLIKVEYLD